MVTAAPLIITNTRIFDTISIERTVHGIFTRIASTSDCGDQGYKIRYCDENPASVDLHATIKRAMDGYTKEIISR